MRTLKQIRADWGDCQRCGLHEKRRTIVFGEGRPKARLMLVAEGPGEFEDKTGFPFVGDSGDILTLFLNNAGLLKRPLTEDEQELLMAGRLDGEIFRMLRSDIYITNLVKCRPPDNRDPSDVEAHACWPSLAAQIYAVDPLLILSVGAPAGRYLLGRDIAITSERGSIHDVVFPGLMRDYVIPVLLLLHPAYLLRNADRRPGGPWDHMHKDLDLARTIVQTAEAAYRGEHVE